MEVASIEVAARHDNGSEEKIHIACNEICNSEFDGVQLVLTFEGDRSLTFQSEVGVFDALKQARLNLEAQGIRLQCMGSDERVYPSPMQQAMGINTLAYKHQLGRQAMATDLIDIFSIEENMLIGTVDEQERFHQTWLNSL